MDIKNGKAVRGYEVIEVLPHGAEVSKGFFTPDAKQSAYNLADSMENEFGGFGTYYFVKVRYCA